jgi:hypothetical protein
MWKRQYTLINNTYAAAEFHDNSVVGNDLAGER